MKNLCITLLLFWTCGLAEAQKFRVDSLVNNGPLTNRINVVILGDGFTQNELPTFRTEAKKFSEFFLNYEPFKEYKNYFNFYSISTPSAESGISNPGNAPDAYQNHPVIKVNNFYGGSFGSSIHRLVTISNYSLMFQVLAENFPQYDLVVVLANTTYYGGSGGSIAVHTLNESANTIGVHEIGHAFAGLSDEYWAGSGYARENLNMSKETDPEKIRWKNWINYNGVGIHPHGASEELSSWKKPVHGQCLMEYLNQPFCPVCKEAVVEKILSIVDPLMGYSPNNTNPVSITESQDFQLHLLEPNPNSLKVLWQLDDVALDGASAEMSLNSSHNITQNSVLEAVVHDETAFSRKNPSIRAKRVSWRLRGFSITKIAVKTEKDSICSDESTLITVSNCPGNVIWSTNETTESILVKPQQTTTYSVSCAVDNSSTLSDSITITVKPRPIPQVANTGPYYEQSTIKLSSQGGNSYSWTGPVGFISALQNPEIVNANLSHSGTYTVEVLAENQCSARASTLVTVNVILSNLEENAWLKVFPNPSSEYLRIEVPYLDNTEAALFTMDGKMVRFITFQKITSLNIENLSGGTYLLKVNNGKNNSVVKVSKL